MSARSVIRNGYVLSMDRGVGEFADGGVLIEDGLIAAVGNGSEFETVDAEVIDAHGGVIMPGFVDTHRHTWQSLLRGLYHDSPFLQFIVSLRQLIAPHYSAQDVELANRLGALEGLSAGVTTVVDYCHCINTPDHADAAVAGLRAAGVRAVFCYGYASPNGGGFESVESRFKDAARVADEYCSAADGLITRGVAVTEPGLVPWAQTVAELSSVAELEALMITHTGCVAGSPSGVRELHHHDLLGPEQIHVHCTILDNEEWRLLAGAGAKVSITPETELQLIGMPPVRECIDAGIKPTLSCDSAGFNSGDILTQMRLALQVQRCRDNDVATARLGHIPLELDLKTRDAIGWATSNGADACGLDGRVGTLAPGKEADIIVVGGPAVNLAPIADPVGVVVAQANATNVRTVLVSGRVVKRDGVLVDVDVDRLHDDAQCASDRILREAGEAADLFPLVSAEQWTARQSHYAANLAQASVA